MLVELICLNCHKSFRVKKHRENTAKFCSKKCETEYSHVTLECFYCGKEFKRARGIVRARQSSKVFCSKGCLHNFMSEHPWNKGLNLIEVTCDWCGKKIIKPYSIIKQYVNHFCSKECYNRWMSKNQTGPSNHSWKSKEVTCDQCGKTFLLPPSKIDRYPHLFCSNKCKYTWRSKNIVGENHPSWNSKEIACNECGKLFFRSPSQIGDNCFCSTKCQHIWLGQHLSGENNPNWSGGGVHYRGPNWHKQRQKALERDSHTCQRCGSSDIPSDKLDVHHIIPFREFGIERYEEANRLENLITLCRSCHRQVEDGLIKESKNA